MKRVWLLPLILLAGCETRPATATAPPSPAQACVLPDRIEAPSIEPVRPDQVVADRPILFHMLAVTWMPETCRAGGDGDGKLACEDQRPGWTLHGLWPNSDGRPYPRYCRPATRVAEATIRAQLCRTPSVDLVQHEWTAHGTCGWATPEAYFRQSAALYDRLRRPEPRDGMTAGQLRDAFAAANPGLPREGVFVAVSDEGRLREVRVCHDLSFRPQACPRGDLGAADGARLIVEPVRR